MEEETGAIVSSYIVSVNKVCNSNAIELECFKQALNILKDYHMHIRCCSRQTRADCFVYKD